MGRTRTGKGDGQRCEIVNRKIAYRPLPSQRRFHESTARFKGFSGPIGSGKSQALCQEAIKLSYQNPGRSGLIGAPTYPMLRDATAAALMDVLVQNKIGFDYNRAENQLVIKETRSKIMFRAVEEFERLRGSNLAWFGLDELTYTSEQAWLRLEGRLRDPKASRLCGFAVWTPKGFDWVHERFIGRKVEGYETVIAAPFENKFLLNKIPDYYDRLLSSYDARFFQQEALGEYVNQNAGRVYYGFDRPLHVAEVQVNPRLPLLWALDFNWDPMSSVLAQMENGKVIVLGEIVLSRATTQQACEEFERRYPKHAAGLVVYADATGRRAQTGGGTSDHAILKEFFRPGAYGQVKFKIPPSNPVVRDRITLMNSKLVSADGSRAVIVSDRCPELIKDFEQVTYKENSQVIDKEKDSRRTHLSDALGYLVWQEFHPQAGSIERDRRLF
jgi:Terminase large subunit, T4likevirus-type, N-terminal/Terminase RNaseH-like domain